MAEEPQDTVYYVSQKTGEPVMKTDRWSRVWGFLGPVLHQWYFTSLRRNDPLWDKLVLWGWEPGGKRAPVSVPHAQFVGAFKDWVSGGMPCPAR